MMATKYSPRPEGVVRARLLPQGVYIGQQTAEAKAHPLRTSSLQLCLAPRPFHRSGRARVQPLKEVMGGSGGQIAGTRWRLGIRLALLGRPLGL